MKKKLKKPITLLLAVTMAMLLNFPSGIFGNIGFGLTANAEDTITFKALDGTAGANNGENYDKLIDGNKTSTKWCVTSFLNHSSVYIVFKASDRIFVNGYTITTGNDNSKNNRRNPKDWTLKGCNDYDEVNKTGGTWETIATVTNDEDLEDEDNADYEFSFTETEKEYQYFKLEITATKGDNCMQMSEFTLSYNTCNHEWAKTDTTIAPTCTEGGYYVYTCSKCGAEKKVPNGTPVTEHDKGEDGKCNNCGTYMISDAAELKAFAAAVNGGETSVNAILTAPITVNNAVFDENGNLNEGLESWTPISDYTGTFDGQGHTISGLYFNDADTDYVGLFGSVGENGAVLNVGVVDSYFQGCDYVGGVCGKNSNGDTIENCYSTGAVSGSYNVGGVCGYLSSGTVTNCYSTGAVNGDYYVGGVCGYLSSGTVTNCYNTGSVSGDEDVGGVCGYLSSGTVTNCYSTGAVDGEYDVGGVCGYLSSGTITNCYYLSKTAGSEAKTAAQFKRGEVAYLLSQGCENGGSIWGQKIGTDDYPVLKGDTVYATTGCVTYNNSGDTSEKEHHYEKGICTDCGKYTEPENKDGVYQISKVTDLYWLADTVGSGNGSIDAVLTNDITVNSNLLRSLEYDTDGSVTNGDSFTYWTPIGSYESSYTGTFDGQGHTISGLYFNDKNSDEVGLFGYVESSGSVSNVGVVDSYFQGCEYVGGVCGYLSSGTVTNCYSTGAVNGDYYVGGVCGENDYEGTITNCYSDNSVPGGKVAIGYDDGDSTNVSSKSSAQFASGAVAYLLNGSTSEGSLVWGQTLGGESADAYPKAHTDTNTVYATTGCVTYNNSGDTSEKEHHYENEKCTDCGKYTEPENKDGVYQISKVTDLYWLADTVNSGNNSVNAVLINDITVNEDVLKADGTLAEDVSGFTSWTPIGYYNSDSDCSLYTGTFDGQGYTISGLYFNDTNTGYVGLFGAVGTDGMISDVGVGDSYFNGKVYVGGVCGGNNGTITNCYYTGIVSGGEGVGGVCGGNGATIDNCYNTGTVSGTGYSVGGVCGWNYGTIENCYNTGSVSGSGNVGGVCGANNSSSGTITNCYNEGTVSGSGNVGGVCGWNYGTIENCYNTGIVSGSGNVGGVCGANNSSSGTITNCYNEGTVSGSGYSIGGVCGWNYGTIENCYNTGSVSGSEGVGGVCGNNNGSGKIRNCYSTGAVDGNRWIGGVCGYNSSTGTITNCYYLKTDTINKDINAIGNENSETVGKAESKTTDQFAGGTVCELVGYHSLQNGIACSLCGKYDQAVKNDGTDTYEISNASQLYWFAGLVNGNPDVCDYDEASNPTGTQQNSSANAVLTADITVNSDLLRSLKYDDTDGSVTNGDDFTDWTPVGYYNSDSDCSLYTGTFDGQGYTISGLYFNDTDTGYVGLFGAVGTDGKISDVGVVDSYFNGKVYVGGVCGGNNGTITNCYYTGIVSGSGSYVGGVCGGNGATIDNCYNTGSVSGSGMVGGVCGYSEGTITNCYYIADSETDEIDGTTFKTESQFNSGEVAYLLQSAQTAAAEGDPIPQVWGQTLTGANKDASPVLTSDTAKTVYKVTFATQSNPTYAVKYANPSGVYELPTAPQTDNDNYAFYKWSTSQTDFSNAANDFTASTAVTGDITVYAVIGEKYGENDNEKTVTTTYGTEKTQDLSVYTVFATGTSSVEKFTYEIVSGNNTKLGATIDGDTLTIPSTAAAGTYTLTIKATVKTNHVSLMAVEFGAEPLTFEVSVTIDPIAEDTPSITVHYADETLTGFESGKYTINNTEVTPTDGTLAVESYIGETISIVKKASDTNYVDSTKQTITVPARPTAPTASDFTVTQPEVVDGTGSIEGITAAMEYSTDSGATWTTGDGGTIADIASGTTYVIRYKATDSSFKSGNYVVVIGAGAVEEITPIGKYTDSVKIEKQVAWNKAVFTITPVSGNTNEISSVTLYLAEYNNNGQLSSVRLGENQIVDGKLTITSDLPQSNNYKFMLWDIAQCPLINAITNIY